MENLTKFIEPVKKIALEAGDAIMEVYRDSAGMDIEKKADHSPLTRADKAANDIIVRGIEGLGAGWPIISEESKEIPYADRKDANYVWLVDPLDGTKEFIKRNGEFTVNIALTQGGNPVLGVVYAPDQELLFWALKGHGAWRLDQGEERPLLCESFSMDASGLRIVCSRSHLNEATQNYVEQLSDPVLVRTGSSLKFTIIARGEADIYPRLAPTMEWDTAAAHCILEEAGGVVLRADNHEALRYNKQELLNPHFIAMGDRVKH